MENLHTFFLASYPIYVTPFDKNLNLGTFRPVFKAQGPAAKERATVFLPVVRSSSFSSNSKISLELLNPVTKKGPTKNSKNVWARHYNKVLAKACYPTIFVKILKVEMVSAWCFYKDANLLPHMGGTL